MLSLNELTIKQAAEGLKKKEFSSAELTEAVFAQIRKKDADIHAFLSLDEEGALARAKEIDEARSKGKDLNDLAGIPVAVKDNMLAKGLKCTSASKILENFVAPYDATVIKKLKEVGAVFVGKTNMDEFAMGSSTENSAFGPTKNPCDLTRVPGGSSGGSAAAVAAEETIYALGSDTGGSIRHPASFCGVAGLKPTYGAVSRFGLMAMASSLDQIGPLGKTVEDCRMVFDAIKGKDSLDSTSVDFNFYPERSRGAGFKIQDLRIGMPKEYFAQGIDEEVEGLVKQAIFRFQEMGAKVKEVSLPHSDLALACYYIIMASEVSANLARFDGIKYGYSTMNEVDGVASDLMGVYLKSRQRGFGDEVRRRIMLGTYSLSAGYYDAYYLAAQKVRTLIKNDFKSAFKDVDVIMTPVSPTPAFKFGEKIADPVKMYLSDIYTVSINLAGVPALSMNCGKIGNLPVGLQIIGPHAGEPIIFEAALAYERSHN
ncbi:MAG: Asp-tRNA(Asn)/Glu-tRNA(Gln) amidotransferase subunit GatA [bacterium]